MKIFLMILLVLVLLIVVICLSNVVASLSCRDGTFEWSVKYFGIRILPRKPKPDKPETSQKSEEASRPDAMQETPKPEEASGPEAMQETPKPDGKDAKEQPDKPLRKTFLMDKLLQFLQDNVGKLDLLGSGIAALPGPFQKLLKSITWSDIETDFVIGGEDAANTARLYGLVQTGVQTVIEASKHLIHVKRRDVRIACDFTADKSKWDFSCKLKVNVGTILAAGIWLAVKFLRDRSQAKKVLVSDVL